jgi:hypothetical protein
MHLGGFEKFAIATPGNSSQFFDAFPILQKLPDIMVPVQKYAKELHREELALYLKYDLRVKDDIKRGHGKEPFLR